MNRLLYYLATLSFVVFYTNLAEAQNIDLGIRAGGNLANQTFPFLQFPLSSSIHLGFLAGGQFDYWFNDIWALTAEVLYDQKGAHVESHVPDLPVFTADEILNYLELPILIRANLWSGNIRPYVFVGPSFGKFLSGIDSHHDPVAYTSIPDSSINPIDISAMFGVGLSWQLHSGIRLLIDAAYALGLVNISNTFPTTKSRDIRLATGIVFPLPP